MPPLLFHLFISTSFSADPTPLPALSPGSTKWSGNSVVSNLTNVFGKGMTALLLIGGTLAVLYLMWAGLQYITSAGSAEKAKTARGAIINAIIGIAVIVAAYFFIRIAVSLGNSIKASV